MHKNNIFCYDIINWGIYLKDEEIDLWNMCITERKTQNIRKFYKLGDEFRFTDGLKGNIIVHDVKDEPRVWREDRDYLYPIPVQERVLTNGNITQNPNWEDGLDF